MTMTKFWLAAMVSACVSSAAIAKQPNIEEDFSISPVLDEFKTNIVAWQYHSTVTTDGKNPVIGGGYCPYNAGGLAAYVPQQQTPGSPFAPVAGCENGTPLSPLLNADSNGAGSTCTYNGTRKMSSPLNEWRTTLTIACPGQLPAPVDLKGSSPYVVVTPNSPFVAGALPTNLSLPSAPQHSL